MIQQGSIQEVGNPFRNRNQGVPLKQPGWVVTNHLGPDRLCILYRLAGNAVEPFNSATSSSLVFGRFIAQKKGVAYLDAWKSKHEVVVTGQHDLHKTTQPFIWVSWKGGHANQSFALVRVKGQATVLQHFGDAGVDFIARFQQKRQQVGDRIGVQQGGATTTNTSTTTHTSCPNGQRTTLEVGARSGHLKCAQRRCLDASHKGSQGAAWHGIDGDNGAVTLVGQIQVGLRKQRDSFARFVHGFQE